MTKSTIRKRSLLLLPLALLAVACTNDALDDGGSPDVVLEVKALENPPVTASLDRTTGVCTFTVEDWSFDALNLAKNETAEGSSPFNDITLTTVTIEYNWIDTAVSTPTRVFGLGGVVVPVGGNANLTFQPIAFDDLSIALSSHTANLTMIFEAVTVEGSHLRTTVGRQLSVESCI